MPSPGGAGVYCEHHYKQVVQETRGSVDNVLLAGQEAANDRQVGGNHYRKASGEQHWDRLIRLWGWPRAKVYFIGQATKYLERHEDKNGLQDLEKAAHFCQKIVEEERKYQEQQNDRKCN